VEAPAVFRSSPGNSLTQDDETGAPNHILLIHLIPCPSRTPCLACMCALSQGHHTITCKGHLSTPNELPSRQSWFKACSIASYTTTTVTPRLLERSHSAASQHPTPVQKSAGPRQATDRNSRPAHPNAPDTPPPAAHLPNIAETSLDQNRISAHSLDAQPPPHPHFQSTPTLPISLVSPVDSSAASDNAVVEHASNATPRNVRHIAFHELNLQELIGDGAFGKVYRSQWQGSIVAVKVMSSEVSQRTDCIHQFKREVETMATMSPHKHVLQMLGACTTGSHFALVTGASCLKLIPFASP
jgi:hypothetical protein